MAESPVCIDSALLIASNFEFSNNFMVISVCLPLRFFYYEINEFSFALRFVSSLLSNAIHLFLFTKYARFCCEQKEKVLFSHSQIVCVCSRGAKQDRPIFRFQFFAQIMWNNSSRALSLSLCLSLSANDAHGVFLVNKNFRGLFTITYECCYIAVLRVWLSNSAIACRFIWAADVVIITSYRFFLLTFFFVVSFALSFIILSFRSNSLFVLCLNKRFVYQKNCFYRLSCRGATNWLKFDCFAVWMRVFVYIILM